MSSSKPLFTKNAKILIAMLIVALVALYYAKPQNYFYAVYVDPELIAPQFITVPPAVKSKQWLAEIEEIKKLQVNPGALYVEAASDEGILRPQHFLTVLGNDITEENYPATYDLMEKAKSNCEMIVHQAKNYWKTTRPHLSDIGVKSLISPLSSPAYPSGHTACSRVWAEILGQIVPEKHDELRAKAKLSAEYRVVSGQHWPHDLAGGEEMALMMFGAFQTSVSYQHDLAAAKKEWSHK